MGYVRPAGTAKLPIVLTARSRPLLHVALLLLVVLATLRFVLFVRAALAYPQLGFDFSVYFAAALALRDNPHANIYSLQVLQAAAAAHGAAPPTVLYLYPQALAALLIPLTVLPYRVALYAWTFLLVALWFMSTALVIAWIRRLLPAAPRAGVAADASGSLARSAVVARRGVFTRLRAIKDA